ncbi:CHAT domain-containing protein [Calothrix sp. 336/3]|uniref:CHAT domain-containing protein n=1 Tax=Calothrix sp. 336/3 TaxID=1337936 RepID=UPI0004E333E2|nr:CHAT domain-containing tetratricopeptide repeat protein [Calothrix sp. 336/3]AKG20929.1 Fis family transcriptional regulator [Calothrix sp. 336/3]
MNSSNYRISQHIFVSLLLLVSTCLIPNIPIFSNQSRVVAQTEDPRLIEGGRWFIKAFEQLQNNQFEASLESWQQALKIFRELKKPKEERLALGGIGFAYSALGDYPKALDYQQQSLKIAQKLQDRDAEAATVGEIGSIYYRMGEYAQAIAHQEKSLAIARETKNLSTQSVTLTNLGLIYHSVGDYRKAIDHQQESLQIAQQLKDRKNEAGTLNNIGISYRGLEDYPKAIEYHQKSLEIAREIKDRDAESKALSGLGNGYYFLGEYQKAIGYHQQSLKIAKEIKDRHGESGSLGNLAVVYLSSGNFPKAIDNLQQVLPLTRQLKDRQAEGVNLHNLGFVFYKQGKLALAEKTLMEGMQVWESLRGGLKDNEKVAILDTQIYIYRGLQQVLIAQNKIDTALEISERGRGRAFVELLNSRLSNKSNTPSLQPPTIAEIKQIAKSQNTTLVEYSLILDEFKFQGKQGWKESELYIWVVKPTGEVTFRKVDLKPLWQKENTNLNELVTTSRESIGARGTAFRGINVSYNPDAAKASNKLKRLHELLINPIADLLPKNPNDRVTFIPQGSLFLVPFSALQDKDGKYLIEKHTILTSPSIQVLDLTRKQKQRIGKKPIQPNNLLIVGNPTMPAVSPKIGEAPQQLSALPGAEREAKAIANLFKAKSLTGNQATETEVTKRLSQAQFIHLATHGLFDNVQGLNSSIALAPGNKGDKKNDGLLSAGEILDLKLNAELVVLSACDTGRGRISGDGVIGLSRSLITAGVPSVLVSLWAVPDAPTAELMTEFYKNISKNPDKAQALRQAMLTTMKQHPNPSSWAAFTLIGEAE